MAKFGKPTGAATTGFDAGSTTQVVRVGNTTTVALFDGDGLQVDIANNAVASITESTEKSSSMRSFAISGTGAGHAKLEAKDASGVVQASMTIQATTGATYAELLADYQPSDAAKQNLSSESSRGSGRRSRISARISLHPSICSPRNSRRPTWSRRASRGRRTGIRRSE